MTLSRERWGALPLGELHAVDRCAYCGMKGRELHQLKAGAGVPLKRTVLAMTQAVAMVCVNTSSCMRRREKARRLVS